MLRLASSLAVLLLALFCLEQVKCQQQPQDHFAVSSSIPSAKPGLSSLEPSFDTQPITTVAAAPRDGSTIFNSEHSHAIPPTAPFRPDPSVFAPDLIMNAEPAVVDYTVETFDVDPQSCAVLEGCVLPGRRRLLRFNAHIQNRGTSDLVIGSPTHDVNSTFFTWNACHKHFHMPDLLDVSVQTKEGVRVGFGMKIGFCTEDYMLDEFNPIPPIGRARYDCAHQGISVGWRDAYNAGLDCQWVDVTGVPAGDYNLVMNVNPRRIHHELSYDNNEALVPVTIPEDGLQQRTRPAPQNDKCPQAVNVRLGYSYMINTRGATSDRLGKCAGVSESDHSVWFKFTGTGKRVIASTVNPNTVIDTVISVYRDCSAKNTQCSQLTCVDASDDTTMGATAFVAWCSLPGVQYYLLVGGAGPVVGQLELTVTEITDENVTPFYSDPPLANEPLCSGPYVSCLA